MLPDWPSWCPCWLLTPSSPCSRPGSPQCEPSRHRTHPSAAVNTEDALKNKGSVSRYFKPLFFPWFKPIWAHDKQVKSIFEFGFDYAEIFEHKLVSTVRIPPQTISAVCITSQRQTPLRGVTIEIFTCLWMILKGQSGEILSVVTTSIFKEKILIKKYKTCWFTKNIFLIRQRRFSCLKRQPKKRNYKKCLV